MSSAEPPSTPSWVLKPDHSSTVDRIRSVAGKVAVVTGGGRGISAQIALGLAEGGAIVAIFDVLPEPVKEEFDAILQHCSKATYYRTDVTSPESLAESFKSVLQDFGKIDICVAGAGILGDAALIDIKEAELRRQIEVNQLGVFFTVQQAARQMVAQGHGGAILVIASIASYGSLRGQQASAYVMTKWAVRGLVRQAALELGQHGIRVNSLSPGYVQTGLSLPFITEEKLKEWHGKIPLGRMERPDELKTPAVFLCSDAAGYITGTDLLADGGSLC
ncbi:short-chain dehydrogenase/reductase [Exophiala viscosa]|uniref:Short-chain dehydrogenase/reductase n=1 Tax=Exophiala viscosa TaxID=2486360 RepID=A0AAN6DNF3_9EURO|nr:short-chain dehydrogenase/reductase [Exophiala viscosa]KAI1625150.1 short-chain dehydrogenase/reductase [Exophiala viscosa]